MESTLIINKIKKIKYISLIILITFFVLISFIFLKFWYGKFNPLYLPNQSSVIQIKKINSSALYLVIDSKKVKDFKIKVSNSGKELKPVDQGISNLGQEIPQNKYYSYYYYLDNDNRKNIRIQITNQKNKIVLVKGNDINGYIQRGESLFKI